MASDPPSLPVFSLVIVAVNMLILILMKETGRPIALMILAATLGFCLKQTYYAYLSQQIDILVQALGAVAFFSIFLFYLLYQMLLGPKKPAKNQP